MVRRKSGQMHMVFACGILCRHRTVYTDCSWSIYRKHVPPPLFSVKQANTKWSTLGVTPYLAMFGEHWWTQRRSALQPSMTMTKLASMMQSLSLERFCPFSQAGRSRLSVDRGLWLWSVLNQVLWLWKVLRNVFDVFPSSRKMWISSNWQIGAANIVSTT